MISRLTSLRTRLRLRRIARSPGSASIHDVELLLRAHGVPETKVWAAVDRLNAMEVSPALAWAFVLEYDGTELCDALHACHPEDELGSELDNVPGIGHTGA